MDLKFVFFGTSSFSVAILEKLISDFFVPVAVVTQPDRPAGRKQELTPPPLKDAASHHLITLFQPEKVSQIAAELKALQPDLFIVAAYGQIIPQAILDIPKLGALNVHTSLLPAYRGASPIQSAILAGEEKTGITIMKMDAGMDHGDIYFQKEVAIAPDETGVSLHAKLAHVGSQTLAKILFDIAKGKMKAIPQDHAKATFTKMITKEDGQIDWNKSATEIDRKIRAYFDWPMAWSILPDGKRLKIIKAKIAPTGSDLKAGILRTQKEQAFIGTGEGSIQLELVQVEGKKTMNGKDFACGFLRFDGQQMK